MLFPNKVVCESGKESWAIFTVVIHDSVAKGLPPEIRRGVGGKERACQSQGAGLENVDIGALVANLALWLSTTASRVERVEPFRYPHPVLRCAYPWKISGPKTRKEPSQMAPWEPQKLLRAVGGSVIRSTTHCSLYRKGGEVEKEGSPRGTQRSPYRLPFLARVKSGYPQI